MNITDLIENANKNFPDRQAYKFHEDSMTFREVYENAYSVATKICLNSQENSPIVLILNKNIYVPSIYLGVALSNCFYVALSTEMPKSRIEEIVEFTQAKLIITDDESLDMVKSLKFKGGGIFTIADCINQEKDVSLVESRRKNIIDTNPLYVLFTSGSTGTPKGVVTSHSAVLDYVETFVKTFQISKDEIFGNQAPLDYIAGIRDIYIPMLVGCKTVFLQKNLFSTPKILFEKLNQEKVSTICWVSPALALCCHFGVFDEVKPLYLKKIFFTGSVLDCECLNKWKEELPNALFVNHYGPTEITASCTFYIVDNSLNYKKIPIGKAFANRKVFVLDENNKLAKENQVGEICVTGRCLASGYYKNPQKTKECFVQNPLNDCFPELMYKTGDLGYLGEDGNLYFAGRLDNQIKYMGHKIELGDIEGLANSCKGINETCCIYDTKNSVLVLFYSGEASAREISIFLRESLPSFMIPRKFISLESLPKLYNGKIDRQSLKTQLGL